MTITLGTTQVSMMNPPNEGCVIDGKTIWNIGRNYSGLIVLRSPDLTVAHPDFLNGMYLREFCQWINSKL